MQTVSVKLPLSGLPFQRKVALLAIIAVGLLAGIVWVWPGAQNALFNPGAAPNPQQSQEPPFEGWWDARRVGDPYGTKVDGLLTFRGNPTRTFYGTGPVPRTKPQELWRYPKGGGMCAISSDENGPREWCGTGYTGQPAVFEREGRTWVVFGAYDKAVHFVDAKTGTDIIPKFETGDIIKGTVTIDPDGYPIVYTGSRDNFFRAIAFDGPKPRELWKISATAVKPTLWNDDWDASALILDDYLFEGGENGQFHIVKLNRGYGSDGKVSVKPELVFHTPSWDDQLLKDTKDNNVSVEGAVTVIGNVIYFANSGGLVQGWDISGLKEGKKPERVFRFWTGDDTDGALVADDQGFLYVGSEYERLNQTSKNNGQMMKLDPRKPDNPLVWKVDEQFRDGEKKGGIYGSPAIYKDLIIWGTNRGKIFGIDRETGQKRWELDMVRVHMSPVVVDGVLLAGDCRGEFSAWDISDTKAAPQQLWQMKPGSCIESTPAVWKGNIYFGTRGGGFHAFGIR